MANLLNSVFALVTLYNPDEDVISNVSDLSRQVNGVFLIDNSILDNSKRFNNVSDNVIYIFNQKNLGLSEAFNLILVDNQFADTDVIFFFDQDSSIPVGFIETMYQDYIFLSSKFKFGCIGPTIYDKNTQKYVGPKRLADLGKNISEVDFVITSGMLTTYRNLKDIGFWSDFVFLDYADWDICWKFNAHEMLICQTSNAILNHQLGGEKTNYLLFSLKSSTPVRFYYRTRDGLKLIFKSTTPFKYKIYFIVVIFVVIPFTIIYDRDFQRMKYYLNGIKDFFSLKRGAV